eukprot:TRINITY_DN1831_c0_g2_i1.p1 TRINITY_DN1831_c0_g2~~TRINITY_DN1831_c0_g2_i1.p1  ORF type:complete len:616 (+),score=225.18 TRINITY_DN1831_c0_g2_i1:92-1849(+)
MAFSMPFFNLATVQYFMHLVWCIFCNELSCFWEWIRPKRTMVVNCADGRVRGYKRGKALVFRGIPYADSVAGAWRWRAARKPQPWKGVKDCKYFSACVPQDQTGIVSSSYSITYNVCMGVTKGIGRILGFVRNHKGSEDTCLTVNVWTPFDEVRNHHKGGQSPALPVMVFIHGGGYYLGSGGAPLYRGEDFMECGCVLVSMNYRLGLPGFLNVPGTPGNRGLRDQLLALEWVRDNIENFGGDPENVTIFGESAGGMSCANLMSSPLRKAAKPNGTTASLFHKVICMSGAAHNVHSKQKSRQIYDEVMSRMPEGTTRADLDTLPYSTLHTAQMKFIWAHRRSYDTNAANDIIGLGPYIDDEVLPRLPLVAVTEGFTKDLCLLAGTTKHEYTLFTTVIQPHRPLTSMLPQRFDRWMHEQDVADDIPKRVMSAYLTSDYSKTFPGFGYHKEYNAVLTDWVFRLPAERLADAHTKAGGKAQVYRYEMSTSMHNTYGACHGVELAPLFGTYRNIPFFHDIKKIAKSGSLIRDTWTRFAKDDLCMEQWPKFEKASRKVMSLGDAELRLLDNPDSDVIKSWGDLEQYDEFNP